MKFALALLFSTACFGICINAGGPATSDCTADQFFTGGSPYVDTTAAPGSLQDMRFGSTFSYSIPAAPGFYLLTLSFVDPNVTAVGGRIFNVTVNGVATPNLDLAFLNGGAKKLYALRLPVISYGSVAVKFTTVVRSAIVNEIRLESLRPLDVFSEDTGALLLASWKAWLLMGPCCAAPQNEMLLSLWNRIRDQPGPICLKMVIPPGFQTPALVYGALPGCLAEKDWWFRKDAFGTVL